VRTPPKFHVSCFISLLGALLSTALNTPASSPEFRGLWVDAFGPGFLDAEQVKKLAADCRKYNFNAVIVEMRRRGDAFYNSTYDPRNPLITNSFDALTEVIKQCHTGTPRLEVHCWVVSHYIWSAEKPPPQPDHIFNRHPEYLTQDSIGQKYIGKGYFLDPGHPDANLTIYNMAKDIVSRYDIDGFHWDYCRYPTQDSGYNETALRRFKKDSGLAGQPLPNDPNFCEWRRRQVTDFLRWVNADLWEIKPNLVISASVFASIKDSYGYRLADWPAWNEEGILDICIPMNFSPDNKSIFFPRADELLKNQGIRHICVGQGAYLNTKENTLIQLAYVRGKGFPGTVFYDYRHPNKGELNQDAVFSFLKERFQGAWTEPPSLPWKKSKGIIKGTVTSAGTKDPIYNAFVTLGPEPARTQKTEPHGQYAFFDVNPGQYTVRAIIRDAKPTEQVVWIKPGRVASVTLSLPP
jgi:uncharacterized lipoprotein YddW (UPF0748 family)